MSILKLFFMPHLIFNRKKPREYLETTMVSRHVLRTSIKKTPYQKSYELNVGIQSFNINFRSANKQFSFLEILIVYNKSNQHNLIYDSYNIQHVSNTCSSFNEIKLDTEDERNKFLLYNQFVVWNCDGYSTTSHSDYANNNVYQELPNF